MEIRDELTEFKDVNIDITCDEPETTPFVAAIDAVNAPTSSIEPVVIEFVVTTLCIDSTEPDFLKNILPSKVLTANSPRFREPVSGTLPERAERFN